MKQAKKTNTKNHKFTEASTKSRFNFTSEPISHEELEKLRTEARKLIKKTDTDALAFRSCWQCNGAHTHFLGGDWGNWVLHCFECNKFYYQRADITEYEEGENDKKKTK
jgi:hypothetical protein